MNNLKLYTLPLSPYNIKVRLALKLKGLTFESVEYAGFDDREEVVKVSGQPLTPVLTDGDKAIYHWRFIGTNTGPDGTGKAVNFTGSETWTFDADGLIEKSVGSFDNNEYERQLKFGVVNS